MKIGTTGMTVEKIHELAARKIAENGKNQSAIKAEPLVMLNFSVEIHDLIAAAESDRTVAAKLLLMAAKQLRMGAVHPMLAAYLADAFESSMAKLADEQPRALAKELHLTSPNRRSAGSWLLIGHAFYLLVEGGMSKNKAKVEIAVEFDIDETTALKYYAQYVKAKDMHDSIE